MFSKLHYNMNAIKIRDPAARNSFEVLLLYPGLHAVMMHQPAHFLYRHHCYLPARFLSQVTRFFTGIEIHPGAKIGKGVFIDHGMGVVIGETTKIGENCTIYQGVTLGGTGKQAGKRHPTLGKNVMVGSGARILGPFHVGDNARIASGAVVLDEVPANATAVGVPARIVRIGKQKLPSSGNDLDQVHLPNPIQNELEELKTRICELEKKLNQH